MTNVIPTDSCYFGMGILADTIPPYNTGNIFVKFDLNGEVKLFKGLTNTTKTYETWQNSLTFLDDSTLVVAGETVEGTILNTLVLSYNLEGDTLRTMEVTNPFFPNYTFMQPRGGLGLTPDGGFVISNWIDNYSPAGFSIDVYALKLNKDWSLGWEFFYEAPTRDRTSSLVVDEMGNTFIGWRTTNRNTVFENFYSQIKIVKLDVVGTVLWEYTSPLSIGLRDAPRDMLLLEDGSMVIASGAGTEIDLGPSANFIWFEKLLFKLSLDGEILWETVFVNPGPQNSQGKLTNVIEVSDGSGFVTAGMEGEDTEGYGTFAVRGWLAKVDLNGNILWTRRYVGFGGDKPRHQVIDLKECPDGGFVIAGESRDGTVQTIPPQQGWLLKLDQYGCLVPGCHLLDDVGEEAERPLQLAIYPNPTTDYLNFQLRSKSVVKNSMFRIVNANGQVMEEFRVDVRTGGTFIVPVWTWPAGGYFLQYLDQIGKVLITEKFIKN